MSDDHDDLIGPTKHTTSIVILSVAILCSSVVCILTLFATRFMRRIKHRIAYLNNLVVLSHYRLDLQAYPEETLSKLALKTGANLQTMREERSEFYGAKNSYQHMSGRDNFKLPDNPHVEVSSSDSAYQTMMVQGVKTSAEIFPNKKNPAHV